ncbi:MAG: hypothetical protein R3E90_07860 [Marinicella sp.]
MKFISWCFGLMLLFISGISYSCGPDFQKFLLSNRYQTLIKSHEGRFDELVRLNYNDYEAPKIPYNAKIDGLDHIFDQAERKVKIEAQYLSTEDFKLLEKAKETEPFEDAKKLLDQMENRIAASYYEVTLKYFDYREHTPERFSQVPYPVFTADNTPWQLWALFNVARGQLYLESEESISQAIEGFKEVIALVEKGIYDTQHVAAGSLGYLATAYLYNGQYDQSFKTIFQLKALGATDYQQRILDNLRYIMRFLPDEMRQEALSQPLTRSLMMKLSYSHFNRYDKLHEKVYRDLLNLNEGSMDGFEYLANYAYRKGLYEEAQVLAEKSNAPLARSVLAKLAIRKDDIPLAQSLYAQIISDLKNDVELNADSCALLGESALILASQGDFMQAFDVLMSTEGQYWADVAYLAENILSIEELKQFIEYNKQLNNNQPVDYFGIDFHGTERMGIQSNSYVALKDVLARRLMRDGQFELATEYFSDYPREIAQSYIQLKDKAEGSQGEIRAMYLWDMAKLTRKKGSHILAFEGSPDWYMYNLNFTGESDYIEPDHDGLMSGAELLRLSQYKKAPRMRWSYRGLAAETAKLAAEYLVPQTPDYEHLLCKAASWVIDQDEDKAEEYFRTFLVNAKPVEDRKLFGRECSTPFAAD